MLYIWSASIKPGNFEKFAAWLDKNRPNFQSTQPKQWRFLNGYFTVFGLGEAHVELHWEIEGYSALDEARKVAHEKGPYFNLLTELHSHLDAATGRGRILDVVGANRAVVVGC